MRKSFTLIEVLIATLILALIGVGALSLVTRSLSMVREARDLLSITLVAEDLVSRDLLGLLPEWEVRGEREGFKWEREKISTQIPTVVLYKYTVTGGGRSVDFIIVKRE